MGKGHGRSQDFSKAELRGGGEGVTLCTSEDTHQIIKSFSPPVVSCLLKKSLQNGRGGGGGFTGTQGHLSP